MRSRQTEAITGCKAGIYREKKSRQVGKEEANEELLEQAQNPGVRLNASAFAIRTLLNRLAPTDFPSTIS